MRVGVTRSIDQPKDEIDTPTGMVPEHPKVWAVVSAWGIIIHRGARSQSEGVVYRFRFVAGLVADNLLEAPV